MNDTEAFALLGLSAGATLDDARVARRRLAVHLHPDRGGDGEEMRRVNMAYAQVVAAAARSAAAPPAPPPPPRPAGRGPPYGARLEVDAPSFVIEELPAAAYEALSVVASWIGELLIDEPPYLLEAHLFEPIACWCRLELVPDAGASTVSLIVAAPDGGPAPSAEAVRDVWVAHLNQLGRLEA